MKSIYANVTKIDTTEAFYIKVHPHHENIPKHSIKAGVWTKCYIHAFFESQRCIVVTFESTIETALFQIDRIDISTVENFEEVLLKEAKKKLFKKLLPDRKLSSMTESEDILLTHQAMSSLNES